MNIPGIDQPVSAQDLDAYRSAAWADADAHFDDRVLEAQRQRVLHRLAHAGQTARVIRFPGATRRARPALQVHRRWISVAAAAGLVIGLVGGQMLHPGSPVLGPHVAVTMADRNLRSPEPIRPVLAAYAADDGLLQEIETAVQLHSADELRALDELTPFREPR